jgi:hypothetical protein
MNINTGLFFGLCLFFSACGTELKTKEIFVELSPDSLVLEQKRIEKKDFEKELKTVIDKKIQEGFKKEELTINLTVDKNTRRGDMADLETAMRRLNVRKVIYSTFGKNKRALTLAVKDVLYCRLFKSVQLNSLRNVGQECRYLNAHAL